MGSRSTLGAGWNPDRQDWTVDRGMLNPFRLRVVFRRKAGSPTVDANTPILESPVFDDLTLILDSPSGRPILAWREEP